MHSIIELSNNYGKLNKSRGFINQYSHGNHEVKSYDGSLALKIYFPDARKYKFKLIY
ncbi:hypothetical protein [Arsenophonus endosymbiont of Aleurodicus floccissimus]|uniref:hypothetical protein n=1 Tax=Arsenophonus endosymbiont of Aleurodicus floccissimus TaxID=2152761 RepID=UPI00160390C7|nr:hypothetical protein [Arsenophonus endosymbiont of Aleurodicus floccissimus]